MSGPDEVLRTQNEAIESPSAGPALPDRDTADAKQASPAVSPSPSQVEEMSADESQSRSGSLQAPQSSASSSRLASIGSGDERVASQLDEADSRNVLESAKSIAGSGAAVTDTQIDEEANAAALNAEDEESSAAKSAIQSAMPEQPEPPKGDSPDPAAEESDSNQRPPRPSPPPGISPLRSLPRIRGNIVRGNRLSADHPFLSLAYQNVANPRCDLPDLPFNMDGSARILPHERQFIEQILSKCS